MVIVLVLLFSFISLSAQSIDSTYINTYKLKLKQLEQSYKITQDQIDAKKRELDFILGGQAAIKRLITEEEAKIRKAKDADKGNSDAKKDN